MGLYSNQSRRRTGPKEIGDAFVIYGMPGIGKSEFAQYAAHNLRAKLRRHARRAGL